MTILTRKDQVGAWPYDSIKWAIEVHMKEKDTGEYNYGVLHGNEDAPLRIQLWRNDPNWNTPCDRDWKPGMPPPTCEPCVLTAPNPDTDSFPPTDADVTGTRANDGTVVSDADPGL